MVEVSITSASLHVGQNRASAMLTAMMVVVVAAVMVLFVDMLIFLVAIVSSVLAVDLSFEGQLPVISLFVVFIVVVVATSADV